MFHQITETHSNWKLKSLVYLFVFLESGDPREVEIRGCSIEAVERIVEIVNKNLNNGKKVNAIQMDNFLWGFRREKAEEMKAYPYHRVRSIFY